MEDPLQRAKIRSSEGNTKDGPLNVLEHIFLVPLPGLIFCDFGCFTSTVRRY